MASISKRTKADGVTVFKASIVIKSHGEIIHRESKTFAREKLARDWGMRREVEMQESSVYKRKDALPIKEVIKLYIETFNPSGATKLSELNKLMRSDIAKYNVHTLTVKDIIKHIRERNKEVKPQTAQYDLVWLGAVITTMAGVIDLDTDQSIFESAKEVLRKERLIKKADKRERRPTRSELWALSRFFGNKWMLHVMWFAIYSCRRQEEITLLRWDDINHDNRTALIRDLKDPLRRSIKKHCKLPRSAYKIIMRQDRVGEFVFPRSAKSISINFTNACHMLGIKDLRFHDLRHEAVSRLFEAGLSIQHVQQVSLHSSWSSLQRYTNLNPGDVDI